MSEDRWPQFVSEFRSGDHQDYHEHWQIFQRLSQARPDEAAPFPAWQPGDRERRLSNLAAMLTTLGLADYQALHRWSVDHRGEFWQAVIDRLGLRLAVPPERILDLADGVERPRWLPGARLNIVDSCFQADPDAVAILHAGEHDPEPRPVTYAELERRVNRVANGLVEHGFGANDAIVLYMPMTVDCVVAYLAIIRAGCRVVSVADSFSPGELRKRMTIAGATAIVTVSSYRWAGKRIDLLSKVRQALEALPKPVRCIQIRDADEVSEPTPEELPWDELLMAEDHFSSVIGEPERVTNVLFSSGTTGVPKAIPWTHLTPLKCAMDGHFHQDIHPGEVVAWPTNIGWMMGPWLIYAALINRATVALFAGAPHGRGFVDFVTAARIDMLGLVPALVRAWRSKDLVAPDQWRAVRVFSSTGEVSHPEDYLWLMSRTGYRAPVIEYLGGTEIGGGHITSSVLQANSPSTFSTPALGLDFVILDETATPTAIGQLGELYLVPPSIGLSQVLLNKDHHETYHEGCPAGPGGIVLRRHGDEFIRLGGGYYRAQGRTDDTMNLGGIKVSSIELEEVINTHRQVFESAAVAVQIAGEGAECLVVFVVPEGEPEAALAVEIGQLISRELNPLFKIHEVVMVEALPRTASNKVMRRELRDRYLKR